MVQAVPMQNGSSLALKGPEVWGQRWMTRVRKDGIGNLTRAGLQFSTSGQFSLC